MSPPARPTWSSSTGRWRASGRPLGRCAEDLDATRRAGASEVVLGFAGDVGFDEALDAYARVTEAAGASLRPPARAR